MKTSIFANIKFLAVAMCIATTLFACEKKNVTPTNNNTNTPTNKWISYYSNVTLGNQDNYNFGSFLKTQTGEVISLENAHSQQGYMAMMFFTETGGYNFITFPGNAYTTLINKLDESNRLLFQTGLGINFWEQQNLNSGEITTAATSSKQMSSAEFSELATSKNWNNFDSKFREYNSGDANLSFVANYYSVENGTIYMVQLNNEIRGFLLVKNVANSSNGASVRFDLIIEGGGEYTNKESTRYIAPGKN